MTHTQVWNTMTHTGMEHYDTLQVWNTMTHTGMEHYDTHRYGTL